MTEAVPTELFFIGFRKAAAGDVLTFRLHPEDRDNPIMRDPLGTRYMAAIVKIGDDDRPIERAQFNPPNRLVQRAGMLCNDPLFQRFIMEGWPLTWNQHWSPKEQAEGQSAAVLRDLLEIKSRKELATNQVAAEKFEQLIAKFEYWKQGL